MIARWKREWLWVLGVVVGCWGMACGPIQSSTKIGEAQSALTAAQAKDLKAWKWSCFEYYAALLYLKKAREEAAYADFEAAADFAAKATKYAKEAMQQARARRNSNYKLPTCARQRAMALRKPYRPLFKKARRLRDKEPWSYRLEEIHKKP